MVYLCDRYCPHAGSGRLCSSFRESVLLLQPTFLAHDYSTVCAGDDTEISCLQT